MNAEEKCRAWPHSWFGFFSHGKQTEPPAPPRYLDLPDVMEFVDPSWRYPHAARLKDYLNQHLKVVALELRQTKCLLCEQKHSPSRFHWDGAWLWPTSLSHYLEVHAVRLPDRMLRNLEQRDFISSTNTPPTPFNKLPWPPVVENGAWARFKLLFAKRPPAGFPHKR
jgi:hypothetical protein